MSSARAPRLSAAPALIALTPLSAATSHWPSAVGRMLESGSVTSRPSARYVSAPLTWSGVHPGCAEITSAAMPATIGAAIEVPLSRK